MKRSIYLLFICIPFISLSQSTNKKISVENRFLNGWSDTIQISHSIYVNGELRETVELDIDNYTDYQKTLQFLNPGDTISITVQVNKPERVDVTQNPVIYRGNGVKRIRYKQKKDILHDKKQLAAKKTTKREDAIAIYDEILEKEYCSRAIDYYLVYMGKAKAILDVKCNQYRYKKSIECKDEIISTNTDAFYTYVDLMEEIGTLEDIELKDNKERLLSEMFDAFVNAGGYNFFTTPFESFLEQLTNNSDVTANTDNWQFFLELFQQVYPNVSFPDPPNDETSALEVQLSTVGKKLKRRGF